MNVMYKVWVGGFRNQNTQAVKLLVQQLTETATMDPDYSMGRTVVALFTAFVTSPVRTSLARQVCFG